MRNVVMAICLLLLSVGCSVKYGDFEQEMLRIKTLEGHLSIERVNVGGLLLDTIGQNGPKIVLGKLDHSQIILPILSCIEVYNAEGLLETKTCGVVPSISIEAILDGKGAYGGDMIGTGEASTFTSGYRRDVVPPEVVEVE